MRVADTAHAAAATATAGDRLPQKAAMGVATGKGSLTIRTCRRGEKGRENKKQNHQNKKLIMEQADVQKKNYTVNEL